MNSIVPTTDCQALEAWECQALDAWQSLAERIALAAQQDEGKTFIYEIPVDARAARSWIAELRRIRGGIKRAHADAKRVHLDRGRAVDSAAKTLTEAVDGLINRHLLPLDEIAAREQARVDCHRHVLDRIAALSQGITSSADASARLATLAEIDPSTLEEFATAGQARWAEAEASILEQRDRLVQIEADRAELEQLRAAAAARQQAEHDQRIRQQAEQDAATALQRAEEARQHAEAEARQLREQQAAAEQARDERAARAKAAQLRQSAALERELTGALWSLGREQIAAAIVAGTLHPAVIIDWSMVGEEP